MTTLSNFLLGVSIAAIGMSLWALYSGDIYTSALQLLLAAMFLVLAAIT